jgi:acetyltransferase-like isoleucine patch superfamily enzyme
MTDPRIRLFSRLRTRYQLRRCSSVGAGVVVRGRLWIHGDGQVILGDGVVLDGRTAPIELFPWHSAEIVIGDGSVIEGGTSIEATKSVRVGARNRIGGFCRIMDSHFHALLGDRHIRPAPRPVTLGDDVTLGPRSIVMAGARIEAGESFGATSVIRHKAGGARGRAP